MEDGLDFLGCQVQWRRKRGTNKWYVYTYIADRAVRPAKAKIRAWTRRTSQRPLKDVLVQINLFWRGWATYFRHAVASHTFDRLHHFIWWRLVQIDASAAPLELASRPPMAHQPPRAVATHPRGRDRTGVPELRADRSVPLPGLLDAQPLGCRMNTQRQTPWRARCVERRTPGSASGLGKRTESNLGTAPQADSPASPSDLPPHPYPRLHRGSPHSRVRRYGGLPLDRAPNWVEHQEIRSHRTPLPHRTDPRRPPYAHCR